MAHTLTISRQQYVDDELLRLPLVADQVFEATCTALQKSISGTKTAHNAQLSDLLATTTRQRARMVDGLVASMREQLRTDRQQTDAGASVPAPAKRTILALLDENEVAADIEISRAIEAIKDQAEGELRELAAFTSAMAGDLKVSRDHNPFRPETYARALWAGIQAMEMTLGERVLVMRQAITPLAQVLRKAYSGICARLESRGIEPADFSTVIVGEGGPAVSPTKSRLGTQSRGGTRRRGTGGPDQPAGAGVSEMPLRLLIDVAMRAVAALSAAAPAAAHSQQPGSPRDRVAAPPQEAIDQHVGELLGRLFNAMLTNERVSLDVRSIYARIQPAARRAALRDVDTLNDYSYPLWRFMDVVAYFVALQTPGTPARDEILQLALDLVNGMQHDPAPDVEVHRRALARMLIDDRRRLRARIKLAGDDIAMLKGLQDQLLGPPSDLPSGMGLLDASQLDTIPAGLMENLTGPREDVPDGVAWLDSCEPGTWMRIFSQGRWIRVQLLWQGRERDIWLFGQEQTGATLALRRRALERLHAEGLLTPLRVRSILRAAAVTVMDNLGIGAF